MNLSLGPVASPHLHRSCPDNTSRLRRLVGARVLSQPLFPSRLGSLVRLQYVCAIPALGERLDKFPSCCSFLLYLSGTKGRSGISERGLDLALKWIYKGERQGQTYEAGSEYVQDPFEAKYIYVLTPLVDLFSKNGKLLCSSSLIAVHFNKFQVADQSPLDPTGPKSHNTPNMQDRGGQVAGVAITFLILTWLTVGLRCYVRLVPAFPQSFRT